MVCLNTQFVRIILSVCAVRYRDAMPTSSIVIKQVSEQLMLIQRFIKFRHGLICHHSECWLAQMRVMTPALIKQCNFNFGCVPTLV